mgnify:FL=1|jgi:hypothetical protein
MLWLIIIAFSPLFGQQKPAPLEKHKILVELKEDIMEYCK